MTAACGWQALDGCRAFVQPEAPLVDSFGHALMLIVIEEEIQLFSKVF